MRGGLCRVKVTKDAAKSNRFGGEPSTAFRRASKGPTAGKTVREKTVHFLYLQVFLGRVYCIPVEVEIRAWRAEACGCKSDVTGWTGPGVSTRSDIHHNDAAGDVLPFAVCCHSPTVLHL